MIALLLVAAAALSRPATAGFNGMAGRPPLGWRSWNQFGDKINQGTALTALDGLTDTSRPIFNMPPGSSLKDLGFAEVGIDEGWASCGWPKGFPDGGWAYHRTNSDGVTVSPVVNETLFPSLAELVDRIHAQGLRAGWYLNDCLSYCFELGDTCPDEICSPGDVKMWQESGFDSVKLDGCSAQHSMALWGNLFYNTTRADSILIENCGNVPPPTPRPTPLVPPSSSSPAAPSAPPVNSTVPYHTYRISYDIRNSFGSCMQNAQYVQKYADTGLHGPGLWAYPDMLMVGVTTDVNGPLRQPTWTEQRTHFGLWCVLSSPLTLSLDFSNTTNTDLVWPIITNAMAINVNQAWAGSPGGRFAVAPTNVTLEHCTPTWAGDVNCSLPAWQLYYKPLPAGQGNTARAALFLLNLSPAPLDLTVPLSSVPSLPCGGGSGGCAYAVTDVWTQAPAGQVSGEWAVTGLPAHDSAFVVLEQVVPAATSASPSWRSRARPSASIRSSSSSSSPAPTFGPYAVNSSWYKVPALDGTDPDAFVVYPSNGTGPFPLISYVHGLAGGDIDLEGYAALFAQIASYGFVLVAPDSCDFGCTDPSRGAPWSDCGGLPDVLPNSTLWAPWYAEGLKLISWARNQTDDGTDPVFQLIDWSKGVGYAGHSMGGQAGVIAASERCTRAFNISAVVLHHPFTAITVSGTNLALNMSVPTAVFTSSGDIIWPDSQSIANSTPARPLAYRDEVGWSHLEPVLLPPIENPLLATFTAAWFKLYVAGDESWRDAVYGTGDGSLCGEAPQVECWAREA